MRCVGLAMATSITQILIDSELHQWPYHQYIHISDPVH